MLRQKNNSRNTANKEHGDCCRCLFCWFFWIIGVCCIGKKDEWHETFGLVVDGGTHVLRRILHSVHLPATLKQVLNNNRERLEHCVKFDDQWETLFPASRKPPDSKTFDITLLHLLLCTICRLRKPRTGWHEMPANDNSSRAANIVRIKLFRDELCHSVSTGIE